jgi:2,5-diamino-6-(ribosylamino)-4(3H)-pyrimidinone 5'-phosphate reductase
MRPKVIQHNGISVDGAITGFVPDMGLHYQVAASFGAQAHLVGSGTAKAGLELFPETVAAEREEDRHRPPLDPDDPRPLFVLVDSRGLMQGHLHTLRGFEHFKDVVVLTTAATPGDYLAYLEEREYRFHRVGEDRVDLRQALELLLGSYGVETVLVDSGPTLCGLLLAQGLVDEVSLVLSAVAVGSGGQRLYGPLERKVDLALVRAEPLEGALHLLYRVRA